MPATPEPEMLKACPWCGGEPCEPDWTDEIAFVVCSKCGVWGPEVDGDNFDTQDAWLAAAATAWNRRAPAPPIDPEAFARNEVWRTPDRLIAALNPDGTAEISPGITEDDLRWAVAALLRGIEIRRRAWIERRSQEATIDPAAVARAAERLAELASAIRCEAREEGVEGMADFWSVSVMTDLTNYLADLRRDGSVQFFARVIADALAQADPPAGAGAAPKFKRGDKVDRRPSSGYRFPGTVLGHGWRLDGRMMYLVELDGYGLVHNFYERDIVPRGVAEPAGGAAPAAPGLAGPQDGGKDHA